MSAPETKALPPAPVTTMTRTPGSASKSSMICATACHISSETALWRAGLLKMMRPIAPSFSASILLVIGWSSIEDSLFRVVGWVEQSETHQFINNETVRQRERCASETSLPRCLIVKILVGFALLYPPYHGVFPLQHVAGAQIGDRSV